MIPPGSRECPQALPQPAGCDNQLVNRHSRYHDDRRARNGPAQRIGPIGIDIIAVGQGFVTQQPIDRDEEQENGSHKAPANLPISARGKANHVAYIVAEALRSINPGDGNGLKEHRYQYGIASSIAIQQMEEIETTLGATGQTNHKVQREQAGHKELAVLANLRELVAQRSDDGLRATKLQEEKREEVMRVS